MPGLFGFKGRQEGELRIESGRPAHVIQRLTSVRQQLTNVMRRLTSVMRHLTCARRRLTRAHTLLVGIVIGALLFGGGSALAMSIIMAEPSYAKVLVDGTEVGVNAYRIENSNYFKLRDIAKALDFGVWFDEESNIVNIETDIGYNPKYTGKREVEAEPVIQLTPLQKSVSVEVDNKKQFDLGKSNTEQFKATITFVEIIRGEKAAEKVKSADVHNPATGIGKEYLLAWVRAKITDSKDKKTVTLSDIRTNLNCYSSDGFKYPPSNPKNLNPVYEQPTVIGDTVEGWVAFAVDRTDPEPTVQIGGANIDDGNSAWFRLYD